MCMYVYTHIHTHTQVYTVCVCVCVCVTSTHFCSWASTPSERQASSIICWVSTYMYVYVCIHTHTFTRTHKYTLLIVGHYSVERSSSLHYFDLDRQPSARVCMYVCMYVCTSLCHYTTHLTTKHNTSLFSTGDRPQGCVCMYVHHCIITPQIS